MATAPPNLETAVDVVVEGGVAMSLTDDGHVSPSGPDEPPLESALHQAGRIGEKVKPGLDREEHEEGELVQPVEVVGDHDVVARMRDVLMTFDLEPEEESEQR